jgi:hypothetical protein
MDLVAGLLGPLMQGRNHEPVRKFLAVFSIERRLPIKIGGEDHLWTDTYQSMMQLRPALVHDEPMEACEQFLPHRVGIEIRHRRRRSLRSLFPPAPEILFNLPHLPRTGQHGVLELPLYLEQSYVGRMQHHPMRVDVLLQGKQGRVGRIVSEGMIDLSVQEHVAGQQRLGGPLLLR